MDKKFPPDWLIRLFREAERAEERISDLGKVEIVSDPNGTMPEVIQILKTFYQRAGAFKEEQERFIGKIKEGFRPGTPLGDLRIIGASETPREERLEVIRRLSKRTPKEILGDVDVDRRRAYPDLYEKLKIRGELHGRPEEEEWQWMAQTVFYIAAQVLNVGWGPMLEDGEWKRPLEVEPHRRDIDLGGGFPVTVQEVSPLKMCTLLIGNQEINKAEWIYRLLRLGILGSGAYQNMTPPEIDDFLRDIYFSPSELSALLKGFSGFLSECLERRNVVIKKARAMINEQMTEDLLGSGWRRKNEHSPHKSKTDGIVRIGEDFKETRKLRVISDTGDSIQYSIPKSARLLVRDGERIQMGQKLHEDTGPEVLAIELGMDMAGVAIEKMKEFVPDEEAAPEISEALTDYYKYDFAKFPEADFAKIRGEKEIIQAILEKGGLDEKEKKVFGIIYELAGKPEREVNAAIAEELQITTGYARLKKHKVIFKISDFLKSYDK
jgi:hypothetical protein